MGERRRYLGERDQNEFALMQARMGQGKKLGLDYFIAKEQKIEIDSARLFERLIASAENVLDAQQAGHHLCGFYIAHLNLGDHVQKIEIGLDIERFGLVNARKSVDAKIGLDQTAHCREKIAGAIAEIRS